LCFLLLDFHSIDALDILPDTGAMNEQLLRTSIAEHLTCTFARSGGPGGQNVNKVNTKVHAFLSLDLLEGLTLEERDLVKNRLSSRIDVAGIMFIAVDTERTQSKNRDIAYDRIVTLIIGAARIPKKRVATKATRASKLRRLETKHRRSTIKSNRSWKSEGE